MKKKKLYQLIQILKRMKRSTLVVKMEIKKMEEKTAKENNHNREVILK